MKQILLDTSFILSAIRNKIDIFEELPEYNLLVPKQVLAELEGLSNSKPEAKIAIKILNKNKFQKIDLKTKNTDAGIKSFAKNNPEIIIATLDRQIKRSIKSKKALIRGRKKIEIF